MIASKLFPVSDKAFAKLKLTRLSPGLIFWAFLKKIRASTWLFSAPVIAPIILRTSKFRGSISKIFNNKILASTKLFFLILCIASCKKELVCQFI